MGDEKTETQFSYVEREMAEIKAFQKEMRAELITKIDKLEVYLWQVLENKLRIEALDKRMDGLSNRLKRVWTTAGGSVIIHIINKFL